MPKKLRLVSKVLRDELAKAGSINSIAVAAGVPQPVLHRFLHGERGLTLLSVDRLAAHLGLELRPAATAPKATPARRRAPMPPRPPRRAHRS